MFVDFLFIFIYFLALLGWSLFESKKIKNKSVTELMTARLLMTYFETTKICFSERDIPVSAYDVCICMHRHTNS